MARRPQLHGLELVVRGGRFSAGRLELEVAVENRGASTVPVPQLGGRDLRIAAAGGAESAPLEVSASIERWAPRSGLESRTASVGRVLFLLPGGGGRHRLRLDGFAPLALDLDRLPPLAGEAAPPERSLAALDPLRRELTELLVEEAAALRARDMRRYFATLTPELRRPSSAVDTQLRAADVGGVDLRLEDAPLATSHDAADAAVELTYWLADIPDDDPFVHRLVYRFVEVDGRWLVRAVAPRRGEQMPFWSEPGITRLASDLRRLQP